MADKHTVRKKGNIRTETFGKFVMSGQSSKCLCGGFQKSRPISHVPSLICTCPFRQESGLDSQPPVRSCPPEKWLGLLPRPAHFQSLGRQSETRDWATVSWPRTPGLRLVAVQWRNNLSSMTDRKKLRIREKSSALVSK